MALKRSSTAVWHGNGPKGNGTLTTLSGALFVCSVESTR